MGASLSTDEVQDFVLPNIPPTADVTGRVTNALGEELAGVQVVATSNQLTGVSGLSFSSKATTDSSGNYTINVVSGGGYTLTYNPANTLTTGGQ